MCFQNEINKLSIVFLEIAKTALKKKNGVRDVEECLPYLRLRIIARI